jgi:hypothetical protein
LLKQNYKQTNRQPKQRKQINKQNSSTCRKSALAVGDCVDDGGGLGGGGWLGDTAASQGALHTPPHTRMAEAGSWRQIGQEPITVGFVTQSPQLNESVKNVVWVQVRSKGEYP